MTPDALLARLLYKDSLILVIDKPAGLAVHAGPKGGENLEQHFHALRFGLPRPPALAHRLDRDTSGCLVLGRHRKALAKLGRLFSSSRVSKVYWAVVAGAPPQPEGRVDLALAKRSTATRGWWMKTDPDGMPAITDYRVMGRGSGLGGDISWLELKPQTGRTHQIRVHCEALGCPVLGDTIYGRDISKAGEAPLHLHARSITLPLYPTREPLHITAPVPEHMRALLTACGWREEMDKETVAPAGDQTVNAEQ